MVGFVELLLLGVWTRGRPWRGPRGTASGALAYGARLQAAPPGPPLTLSTGGHKGGGEGRLGGSAWLRGGAHLLVHVSGATGGDGQPLKGAVALRARPQGHSLGGFGRTGRGYWGRASGGFGAQGAGARGAAAGVRLRGAWRSGRQGPGTMQLGCRKPFRMQLDRRRPRLMRFSGQLW